MNDRDTKHNQSSLGQISKVVTRFAPSPTGFLHVGSVRTALYAYLWARKNNGTFILRIEDTDKKREVSGSIEHIKESLRWLGLDWDRGPDKEGPHGPYIQSERLHKLDIYNQYAQKLLASGHAYADTMAESELEKLRKTAELNRTPFFYRDHRPRQEMPWRSGMPLRFMVRELKRTQWRDLVRGELTAGSEALDDFVLIKSDGYPTYNFAHIVDDIEMGVTHVIRGEEFIPSTPNYLALYSALGVIPPAFATMPPIQRDDKTKKLGKRDGAKDVLEYKQEGYLPEAMFNFLALIGWNPGGEQEIFSKEEIIKLFSLERVSASGGAFNEIKLKWMNKEHLKRLSPQELGARAIDFLPEPWHSFANHDEAYFVKVAPLITERIEVLGELRTLANAHEFDFYWQTPEVTRQLLKTTEFLPDVITYLESIAEENFTVQSLKTALWNFATEKGRANVLWPMRVALTGKEKSPDPFTVASVLGKTETLKRLRAACDSR